MNQKAYIKHANKIADKYAKDVLIGRIVANKLIKLTVKRYNKDVKLKRWVKDQAKVDRVYRFFSYLNINIKNKYSQFELMPYQAFIIKNLFLFYHKNGDRRFRYFFLYIARKNGKTVFASALNLYFLIADNVTDPQVLLLASTREQAAIALEYSKNIVLNSPALKKVKRQRYKLTYSHGESTGFMKTLASNAGRLDGYSPCSAILDEVHAYPNADLFNVIKSAILAEENPLISLITTAGFNIESLAHELLESSKIILNGTQKDESFLPFLYTLDENDDYNDSKVWAKSNPAIGTIIKKKDLQIEYNSTKIRPSELPNFLTKHMNVFTDSVGSWIEEAVLNKAFYKPDYDLTGLKCYGGLDLSSTKDLCNFTLLFDIDGFFVVKTYFFFVNNPEKTIRKAGLNLSPWINAGHIVQMETKTLDYDLLLNYIQLAAMEYNIYSIDYDPFNSALIVPKINEMGINTNPFVQSAAVFNFPLKYLEKQLYDENICMSDNPVLKWNMRNIVLYQDGNGNIKIMKNKSNDSVDGSVSLGMAFRGWIAENIDSEKAGLEAYLKS